MSTGGWALTLPVTPSCASDLAEVLDEALRLRKSEATERNPVSSRSHADPHPISNQSGSFEIHLIQLGQNYVFPNVYFLKKQIWMFEK